MNNKSKLIFRAASIASINTQRQRISPWKVSEREFYVILMRLNEALKMKQFPFCLHGSRLKRNGTFHASLQKEVQSTSRWAGLNQQSANLAKPGVWAQCRDPHEVWMLWAAYHEARRCPTCSPMFQAPRGRIPVWGRLWVVLTQPSQPTALTPGMVLLHVWYQITLLNKVIGIILHTRKESKHPRSRALFLHPSPDFCSVLLTMDFPSLATLAICLSRRFVTPATLP